MDAWEQLSALLVPHPKPHLFTGKKRLYRLTAPSSSDSRSSFMSSLSDGTQKRRKLTKTRRTASPPPEIQPLSFDYEPMLDMTTNSFNFFPLHDSSDVNDHVNFLTPNANSTTLDGNLMSQPTGHVQSTSTHFPRAIITSVSSISPSLLNPNSSLVTVSMSSNAATGQSEANSPFFNFPNPLGYISRKLTKRRRSTPIPKSASTPLIPSEATPTIDTIPSFSSTPTTVPKPTASKLAPLLSSPSPSCSPPLPTISAGINHFHLATGVTDNVILASSTVPTQHAPQCTLECCRFQAENRDSATSSPESNSAIPIAHAPGISSACKAKLPQLPHKPTGRFDNAVHRHKPELASIIPADISGLAPESGLWASENNSERAFPSEHFHIPGSPSGFEPLTPYMRASDVEATKPSSHYDNQEFEAIPIAAGPGDIYKASGENSHQYHNAIVHRMTDHRTETKEILLPPTLNRPVLPANAQCISVAPPTPPTMTTHGHGWSSTACSGELHRQDQGPSPSPSGEEEGIVAENIVADVTGAQELPLETINKPVGSGIMSLTLAKWNKKDVCSMTEEETMANTKSEPGINQRGLSTRGDGDDLSRSGPCCSLEGCSHARQHLPEIGSNKVNCGTSQLISSTSTDNSTVTITQVTASSPLFSAAHPEGGPAASSVVAAMNIDKDQKPYKSIKISGRPKFIIGDLEEGAVEFPVRNMSTEVRDEPEQVALEDSNTAPLRPRLLRRGPIADEESKSRRWTLASALTDEKISDAGLVKVLDRMRDDTNGQEGNGGVGLDALDVEKVILEGWGIPDAEGDAGSKDNMRNVLDAKTERPVDEYGSYLLQTETYLSPKVDAIDRGARSKTMRQHNRSRSTPSQAWVAAQRALLTCRELILTERHYVAQLSALVQQQTATLPPPLMCEYAKELLRACERVLKRMEKDPSARGVSRAFLEGEEEVQGAYSMWCGAVGGWFSVDGGQDSSARPSLDLSEVSNRVRRLSVKRRNRVGSKTEVDKSASPVPGPEGEDTSMNPLKRTVSTWRRSMPTLGFDTPALYGGGDRKKEKESEREATSPSARKPAVRELAILPTQRVMRYALIYQELLLHTPPTSPSRTFVESAAHAAARIAEKCDLAQGNAAFIASSPNGGGSHTRSSSRTGARSTPSKVPPLPTALVVAEPLTDDTVPASPISIRSAVDSPFRSSTQFFQSTNSKSNTEITTDSRRLSVSFMSFGWGKSNKRKIRASTEGVQVLHTAGVSSLAYHA